MKKCYDYAPVRYALFNFTTAEVYSSWCEARPSLALQNLYKRALSNRRYNLRHGYAQDDMRLCLYDFERFEFVKIIEEWKGGNDTPITEIGLSLPAYNRLFYCYDCKTVREALRVVKESERFQCKVPHKIKMEIVNALMPYDRYGMMEKKSALEKRAAWRVQKQIEWQKAQGIR